MVIDRSSGPLRAQCDESHLGARKGSRVGSSLSIKAHYSFLVYNPLIVVEIIKYLIKH